MTLHPARYPQDRIAVVGMAARLPGVADLDAFWRLLTDRASALQRVGRDDLLAAGLPATLADEADYVPFWGGPPEADGFDAGFFGYSPREAELMDPQQRMFLECGWHALEDAGYAAGHGGAVGVYAGASLSGHLVRVANRADPFRVGLANIGGMVAARVSFHLDLTGPSIGVQTTCSSSLVAVHQAMAGLRLGECDMALAGAVAVNQPRPEGYRYQQEGIAAPDGTCRPFDAEAAGTVFTNGAAVVVLKRLDDALRDGDTIHGVLLGSAVNNDGAGKISLTAPGVAGQTMVLQAALAAAGIGAGDVDYVETHGTGTAIGDPLELTALNRSYGPGLAAAGRRCALGAVKGNVGHLDAAAGMAGLIKILLALRHDHLPGTAHFDRPNPKCAFGAFDVLKQGRDWPRSDRPRRAGLSAFGIGGTNAHLIVEEPPLCPARAPSGGVQLLPLSARDPEALARLQRDLAARVEGVDDLDDIAFTLQTGRRGFAERRVVVAGTGAEAARLLRGDAAATRPMAGRPDIAFVFSGQGSQQPGMACDLHADDAAFRAALDDCLALMPAELGLRDLLLDPGCEDAGRIHQTRWTQPALFAFEYALARLWMARGVRPDALLGHSIGEYVAACLAGVFDLGDAVRLVLARGEAMQSCPPGAMLAVMMSEAEARAYLPEGVEIAAINGPRSVVLAGTVPAIAALAADFERSGVGCRGLQTSHGFHSAAMDAALPVLARALDEVRLNAPQLGVLSNVTGDWLTEAEATDPAYWLRQLRQPVRFADGVRQLTALDHPLLLEIGPGAGLARLARQSLSGDARAIASLPGATGAATEILHATGELWAAGVAIDWSALHQAPRRRLSLPGYPFQRQSCWLPPTPVAEAGSGDAWFNQPVWHRLPWGAPVAARRMIIGPAGLFSALGKLPDDTLAVLAEPGAAFAVGPQGYGLDPTRTGHYEMLLAATGGVDEIVLGAEGAGLYPAAVALAQALAAAPSRPRLTLIGASMHEVTGREALDPAAAMALGLAPALAQECGVDCRVIDLDPHELGGIVPGFAAALAAPWDDGPLALRAGYLWRGGHVATRMDEAAVPADGPILIVGDLVEGLGPVFTRALRAAGVALILAGSGLPDPADWDGWLATHGASDPASRLIAELRGAGPEILILAGDEADAGWLDTALAGAEARLGPVAGVFQVSAMGEAFYCPLAEAALPDISRRIDRKCRAIAALRQVLSRRSPAFCLVQSSFAVLAGGHGLGPYAAASAAVEAEVALARRQGGTVWQAVQWDAVETGTFGDAARLLSGRMLTEAEVWQAAGAILARPQAGQVAVTPGSLSRRLAEARKPAAAVAVAAPVRRSTAYVAPRDAYESAVALAMTEMLGVPDIGAEDNFFELGGHSLLAIQIINRLKRDFAVELPMRALLYETPTVAGIAAVIRKAHQVAEAEGALLEDLLDEIEGARAETAG